MFFKRLLFLHSREGREMIRMKESRKAVVWADTVPASFGVQYKLVCWPMLPERHRTASVLRALSRMTVETFDFDRMSEWTGLQGERARILFELFLHQGWIEPVAAPQKRMQPGPLDNVPAFRSAEARYLSS